SEEESEPAREKAAPTAKATPAPARAEGSGPLPMFGGSPSRNMVNLVDKNLPTEWDPGQDGAPTKNIKWVAQVGTRSYGGPVSAGGKVFAATNNEKPRAPKVTDQLAVLMCFNEADGKFLWQTPHEIPPGGIARDATQDGLCPPPVVEGDRL